LTIRADLGYSGQKVVLPQVVDRFRLRVSARSFRDWLMTGPAPDIPVENCSGLPFPKVIPMNQKKLFPPALLVAAVAGLGWLCLGPLGADARQNEPAPKKTPIQLFMRKKLEATQKVMEGLAIEDYDLIGQGARQLEGISAAADFAVVKEALYTQHADEFRRTIAKIQKGAKEKRLDSAALGYMDMTMSCIECHKFVRNMLITDK